MAYQGQGGLLNPMLTDLMQRGQQPLIHPTGIQPLGAAPQRPAAAPAAPSAPPVADIPAADYQAPASQAPTSLGSGGSGSGFLNGLSRMDPEMLAALIG